MADGFGGALCAQTVTLYHADPAARTVARTVIKNAFLDTRRRATLDGQGAAETGAFLLVVPQQAARFGVDYTLQPLDRVLAGEGPAVEYADWAAFTPAAVPGLVVVQYVDAKTRRGLPCHVEAGGWWTGSGTGAHSLTD